MSAELEGYGDDDYLVFDCPGQVGARGSCVLGGGGGGRVPFSPLLRMVRCGVCVCVCVWGGGEKPINGTYCAWAMYGRTSLQLWGVCGGDDYLVFDCPGQVRAWAFGG
jgi:hypothetical protein